MARRSLKFSKEDWNAINMNMVIKLDGDTNIQIDNGQLELLTITMGEEGLRNLTQDSDPFNLGSIILGI